MKFALAAMIWLVTASVHAQDVEPTEEEARIDAWLEMHAHRGEENRIIAGIIGLALGCIEIPVESVILASQPPHPTDATTPVFASVGISFGVLDIAYGIYRLAFASTQEDRVARWRAVRARGSITERDVGRFEGEIRGELGTIEDARRMWLVIGIGLVAAGAVAAGLTAGYADSDLGRWVGYGTAGGAALGGVLAAILPWLDTNADSEWERIDSAQGPRVSALAPWISPYGVGLTMNGSF